MTTRWMSLLLLLSLALPACAPLARQSAEAGPLPVVVTFSVLADIVHNVGGEHIIITTLAGVGVDTHTFNPSPQDAAALAGARVIFENGADLEGWLDDLYAASGSRAVRVVVSDGVTLREGGHAEEEAHGDGAEHANEAEHADEDDAHDAYDPHIWHSVANAMAMTQTIREALTAADPAHSADYEANARAYHAELQVLDAWVSAQVETLPAERRKLVTTHDTLGYFADRYGFEVLGSVLPSSTEGASPSARELAALVDTVRGAGVPAVFAENVSPSSLINQVANEAGVEVVGSLYTDALGPPGSGAETYRDMIRTNTTAIVTALGR